MRNPFESELMSVAPQQPATERRGGVANTSRFPPTVTGHDKASKYERVTGTAVAKIISPEDDGVTHAVYLPRPLCDVISNADYEHVIVSFGWKASYDAGKEKKYFSKLDDKKQRCWTLPSFDVTKDFPGVVLPQAAPGKVKKTTSKAKKKSASSKKKKASSNQLAEGSSGATQPTSPGTGENSPDTSNSSRSGSSSSSEAAYHAAPVDTQPNAAAADPFQRFIATTDSMPSTGCSADDDPFTSDPYRCDERGALNLPARRPLWGAPEDDDDTDVVAHDREAAADVHRSLSGRHLEEASSVDIPDDAVPPLSSPMPRHSYAVSGGEYRQRSTHTSAAAADSPGRDGTTFDGAPLGGERSRPPCNDTVDEDYGCLGASNMNDGRGTHNRSVGDEVDPQLAWLTHELDMLPDDEESARDDIVLTEATDRDCIAYESAADYDDISFQLPSITPRAAPTEEEDLVRVQPPSSAAFITNGGDEPDVAATVRPQQEIVGILASLIVEESDKFRRKESDVHSELAVLIQKKVLEDRLMSGGGGGAREEDADDDANDRTPLEELLASTSEGSPHRSELNSISHSIPRDSAPTIHTAAVATSDERSLATQEQFPSFSQSTSATFAEDDATACPASPELRDDDFPMSKLAHHLRNDSIYVAHHRTEHLAFVKDGIDHPDEHHHIASIAGEEGTLASVGRRHRRASVEEGDLLLEPDNELHPSFVSSVDLKRHSLTGEFASVANASAAPPEFMQSGEPHAIASPFAAAAAGARRNRRELSSGVVFMDQVPATPGVLCESSVADPSRAPAATKAAVGGRQRVVMLDDPPNSPSVSADAAQSTNVDPLVEVMSASDDCFSPSFGPRHDSMTEGSPFLVNSPSSFTLGGPGRRLRRARDSMIIARDPDAHRTYVLEKSAEKDAHQDRDDSQLEEDRAHHHHRSHDAVQWLGAAPTSEEEINAAIRRASVETLGSSTTSVDARVPLDDEKDSASLGQRNDAPQSTSSSHYTAAVANHFSKAPQDSITIAQNPTAHREYVRDHANAFSALSGLEWAAVEQQRRRLLEDDAHRGKLESLQTQLLLQQYSLTPTAPTETKRNDGSADAHVDAGLAIARLRQATHNTSDSDQRTERAPPQQGPQQGTVPLLEREAALRWIQQEARARILHQTRSEERSWVTESLVGREAAVLHPSPIPSTSKPSSYTPMGNDPNILLEQRLAEVMGRLLTQDSMYLYQQALDAKLLESASWSLEAMSIYRAFVDTMPPKTREVAQQAPEGGLTLRETGTDPRQLPPYTPSYPLGEIPASDNNTHKSPAVAVSHTSSLASQQQQRRDATATTITDPPRSDKNNNRVHDDSETEEGALLARLERIRALRDGQTVPSHLPGEPVDAPASSRHDHSPMRATSYSSSSAPSPIPALRRSRMISTPALPRELQRPDAGASLRRMLSIGRVGDTPRAENDGSSSWLQPERSPMYGAAAVTPIGFQRADQQPVHFNHLNTPASSVISTPPPPNATPGFPVFAKPTPKTDQKSQQAVLRWDIKRSGNVLISQSGTLTMSDSSRALKALHEEAAGGRGGGVDTSLVAIPMFALGTVGISQGDLVFEVRLELRPSKEAMAAKSPMTPVAASRQGRQLLSSSAFRPGQRAPRHQTFIGVASKYYRGSSRSTPAYLLCSDGTISAPSALSSSPHAAAEAVPYGRPFHCSAVVTVHLSFSRRELSFAVDGVPQGTAFKFQPQDDPEPLFPVVVFTGDGDSCAFQAPTLPSSPGAGYLHSSSYMTSQSPHIGPHNVSRPLY